MNKGMLGYYCINCIMAMPHFTCYPMILSESDVTVALLKNMAEKVDLQANNNGQQQWGQQFPPPFTGRPPGSQHPFNYEEQHRVREPVSHDFDNDLARQQTTAPFMQHFFPRIVPSLPFPDFTDYQRFNGFQRNAFFPTPFGPQFVNPAWNSFQISPAMHNPMMGMDNFNTPQHGQHPSINSTAKGKESLQSYQETSLTQATSSTPDKPPVLLAEYNIKQSLDEKFESGSEMKAVKDEPMENLDSKKQNEAKTDHQRYSSLSTDKQFEQSRTALPSFTPTFYSVPVAPLDIATNNTFKPELSPPPGSLHDCQVCLSTHANGLHFGARTCAACAAFFRRTISDDKSYVCKRNQRCTNASRDGTGYRKICRACRMKRCVDIGMLPENVQHKRARRESTGSTPPPPKIGFDNFFPGCFYPPFQQNSSAVPSQPSTAESGRPSVTENNSST
ncbi:Protein CBR-ODR-7 [Caenorhabditis briggsae]|uniref:Protein CBR-ODR-7 n=2 Tax=Caenorhabditis briggsae TaxID=6238 RepID=A8WMC0_CAEBR|nr:Protein CBR-ODR-7 [Caenorhabditis briggsae]CAP21624.2 Protein CBR-ODR-7 [Caenorhabditis briggsae]